MQTIFFFNFLHRHGCLKQKQQRRVLSKLSRFLSLNLSLLHKPALLKGNCVCSGLRCITRNSMALAWALKHQTQERSAWYKVPTVTAPTPGTRLLNKCLIASWSTLTSKCNKHVSLGHVESPQMGDFHLFSGALRKYFWRFLSLRIVKEQYL